MTITSTVASSLALLAGTCAFACSAFADNAAIDNALKSRPELSSFYNALVTTGVINELRPHQPYTVFAPTNDAFARYPQSQYGCLYSTSPDCLTKLAEVLRTHIVPGEKHLNKMSTPGNEGDVDSLFSISNRHIVASEPDKDHYRVDGIPVLSENQLLGGELYEINGIIATQQDLAKLQPAQVVVVHEPAPPPLPAKTVVTTTDQATTPIPH